MEQKFLFVWTGRLERDKEFKSWLITGFGSFSGVFMNTYLITGGPGKFDFAISLFQGDFQNRSRILFEINNWNMQKNTVLLRSGGGKLSVVIDSVERIDGTGELWEFTGVAKKKTCVFGRYSSLTRQGEISECDPKRTDGKHGSQLANWQHLAKLIS